jgi:hypothetical protein
LPSGWISWFNLFFIPHSIVYFSSELSGLRIK